MYVWRILRLSLVRGVTNFGAIFEFWRYKNAIFVISKKQRGIKLSVVCMCDEYVVLYVYVTKTAFISITRGHEFWRHIFEFWRYILYVYVTNTAFNSLTSGHTNNYSLHVRFCMCTCACMSVCVCVRWGVCVCVWYYKELRDVGWKLSVLGFGV